MGSILGKEVTLEMEFFKFDLSTQNINKYLNILLAFEPNTIKAKVEISES